MCQDCPSFEELTEERSRVTPMNEIVKQMWITQLRVPGAEQAKGVLKDERGARCCLGVLCDIAEIAGQGTWSVNPYCSDGRHRFTPPEGYSESTITPTWVTRWSGLGDSNPEVPGVRDRDGNLMSLAHLNDTGLTFPQIADVIEFFL